LLRPWVVGLVRVDVHGQRYSIDAASFLLVLVDGRVERDAVNPCPCGASALVVVEAVPKPDEDLLKQVIDFGLVAREHVAHRVDGPLVLPHQDFKLMFLVVVHNAFFVATFIMLDNEGKENLHHSNEFC
jgi:hypothetical protein